MNIASILKSELSRVARKEVRGESGPLKKSSAKLRSDVAALKRRMVELEKLVRQSNRGGKRAEATGDAPAGAVARFSGKGLAAQRKRLGLSAANFGKLLGVSGASVYLYEENKTRPRPALMQAIAEVRKMSKRQAQARLSEQ